MNTTADASQAQPFVYTLFTRNDAPQGTRHPATWPAVCSLLPLLAPTAASKLGLPLIKLATFADDYRNNANLETIFGVEGDYDGEVVQPEQAVQMLQAAGIEALVYTSPSHQPDAPRWRVLAPLSAPVQPSARYMLTARLNGALDGILAPESFAPSQAYYYGAVSGGEPVQWWPVAGQPLDLVDGIMPHAPATSGTSGTRHDLGDPELAAPSLEWVRFALSRIDPNDLSRAQWVAILAAAKQAAWSHATPEAVEAMLMEWCARYEQDDTAENVKQIRSMRQTEVGWPALTRKAPGVAAQMAFGGAVPVVGQEVLPAAPYEIPATGETTGGPSHLDVLRMCRDLALPLAHDTFADRLVVTGPMPGERSGRWPRPMADHDCVTARLALNALGQKPGTEALRDGLDYWARMNPFNPITDWLDGLVWDGVPRLDGWLSTYLGVAPGLWPSLVGPKFLIAMVARAMVPGTKVDTVLVLEGEQGLAKSTALEIVAGEAYFDDRLPPMHDKDALQHIQGLWLVEIGELASVRKSEIEEVKAFITSRVDRWRPAYGRHTIERPRQTVFAATTNADQYLADHTGNRRWWPVRCGEIALDALRRDREQLFAEAVHRWRVGERWWLDRSEEQVAQTVVEEREELDPWHEQIEQYCLTANGQPITMAGLLVTLGVETKAKHAGHSKRVAQVLRKLGWRRRKVPPHWNWAYVPQ